MTDQERRQEKIINLKRMLAEVSQGGYFDHLKTAIVDNLMHLEFPELATPSFRDFQGATSCGRNT